MKKTVGFFHGQDNLLPLQKQAQFNVFEHFNMTQLEINRISRCIDYLHFVIKKFPKNIRNTGYVAKIDELVNKRDCLQEDLNQKNYLRSKIALEESIEP